MVDKIAPTNVTPENPRANDPAIREGYTGPIYYPDALKGTITDEQRYNAINPYYDPSTPYVTGSDPMENLRDVYAGNIEEAKKAKRQEFADYIKSQNPGFSDAAVQNAVNDAMSIGDEFGRSFYDSFGATGEKGTPGGNRSNVRGGYNSKGEPQAGGQFDATGSFVGSASASVAGGPGTPEEQAKRKSAYDLLYEEFNRYGLGGLVEGIKGLVQENVSPSEFAIRLRQTDAYKKRFAANEQRIAQGLAAIDEATYIGLEDQYQEIMRQYGLPASYYAKGNMGRQEGFEKFIASDISASELEDRIMTAQNRVLNANPEVSRALKEFYPDITNGDILAYTLDPKNAIKNIQRKVTAAEIGGAAMGQGLETNLARAQELAGYGVDKAAAQQGFATVAQVAPRGGQLAEIYKQDPYTQQTAEQEVFNLAGSAQAAQKRKKLTELETAAFSGKSGLGALARDRAGAL